MCFCNFVILCFCVFFSALTHILAASVGRLNGLGGDREFPAFWLHCAGLAGWVSGLAGSASCLASWTSGPAARASGVDGLASVLAGLASGGDGGMDGWMDKFRDKWMN